MPQVTAKPRKGGVSIGRAQLDFGGVIPEVCLPSRMVGLYSPGCTAALYSLIVCTSPSVDAQLVRQFLNGLRFRFGDLVNAILVTQQMLDLVIENLHGHAEGLLQISRPYLAYV